MAHTDTFHSEQLASIYSARANIHANERYRLESLHWLGECQRVLDVGCGTTDLISDLRADLRVLGIDKSIDMLASRPTSGHAAAAQAEILPFANGTFDGVLSINVLEHVSEPGRVLKELARVLCKGGRVVLVTPAAEWWWVLELAERMQLKLPEGPHRFLPRGDLLRLSTEADLHALVCRRILTFPFGGKRFARAERFIEQLTPGIGNLHLLVAERR